MSLWHLGQIRGSHFLPLFFFVNVEEEPRPGTAALRSLHFDGLPVTDEEDVDDDAEDSGKSDAGEVEDAIMMCVACSLGGVASVCGLEYVASSLGCVCRLCGFEKSDSS